MLEKESPNEENKKNLSSHLIKYKYKVSGIFLIFDNITSDFNYFYRLECIKDSNSIKDISDKLKSQLDKTTFNEKLKDNNINDIINDYFLYFITRNNSLNTRTKDLPNIIKILEKICNIKFNLDKRNGKEI